MFLSHRDSREFSRITCISTGSCDSNFGGNISKWRILNFVNKFDSSKLALFRINKTVMFPEIISKCYFPTFLNVSPPRFVILRACLLGKTNNMHNFGSAITSGKPNSTLIEFSEPLHNNGCTNRFFEDGRDFSTRLAHFQQNRSPAPCHFCEKYFFFLGECPNQTRFSKMSPIKKSLFVFSLVPSRWA